MAVARLPTPLTTLSSVGSPDMQPRESFIELLQINPFSQMMSALRACPS
ncbi:unnamed protein product [Schistocephalus solidus]|uniref:Uncharacterized protein n=1 Tax=Schistocephalus solidus TaxID=70667 RepID=A0A183SBS2_SCHSO|nr:unnamed protein product [Schistocephalus solidus]